MGGVSLKIAAGISRPRNDGMGGVSFKIAALTYGKLAMTELN